MMNGFNHQPHIEDNGMATNQRAASAPKWKDTDKQLGDQLIRDSEGFSGGFIQKFGNAAKRHGYGLYKDVPPSVRTYIQSTLKQRERTSAKMDEAVRIGRGENMTPEERWFAEVDGNTVHGLHPEDEKDLREALLSNEKVMRQ